MTERIVNYAEGDFIVEPRPKEPEAKKYVYHSTPRAFPFSTYLPSLDDEMSMAQADPHGANLAEDRRMMSSCLAFFGVLAACGLYSWWAAWVVERVAL